MLLDAGVPVLSWMQQGYWIVTGVLGGNRPQACFDMWVVVGLQAHLGCVGGVKYC